MRKRFIAAFLALFCAIALATTTAVATGIDESKSIRLTLKYSNGVHPLSGVTFYLYKVGDYVSGPVEDDTYDFKAASEFEGAFDDAESELTGLKIEYGDASKLTELAKTLDEYIVGKNVEQPRGKATDKNGQTVFNGLEPGLYLVRGETKEINGTTYIPQTFLIPLPYPTTDNGFSYKVTANVKPIAQTPPDQPATGSLTVSKTVTGSEGDTNQEFHFTVALSNASINGPYSGMTFTNGVATFTLKHNQSKTAADLPAGISYTVTETEANMDGYVTTIKNSSGTITGGSISGTITGGGAARADFTNTKNVEERTQTTGNLTVSKTVSGSAGERNRKFNFIVTLSDTSINGTHGDMYFENGVAEFTLTDGESKVATGLPAGITYTVTEVEADADGYVTTGSGNSGAITDGSSSGAITGGGTARANFINTKNLEPGTGNLTVSKTVEGNAGERDKEFHFTVTLDDTSINGTYGDMDFTDGVAEVTLKHGESKTATGLPADAAYTVTEEEANENDYVTVATNDTGTIPDEDAVEAVFTNTREIEPGTGNLTVSKTVAGNAGDTEQEFKFTVTLDDTSINGTYGDMDFTDGVASFTLKHGESKTAAGLPADTAYTVTEKEANEDGYVTDATGEVGIIPDEDAIEAVFTNTRDIEPGTGNLTVSKTVAGNSGDRFQEFYFTVTLSDSEINGTYGDMTFVNGVASFTLRGGKSKTAAELPADITYTVTEAEANQDGYVTTASGSTGTITDGGAATASFTNTKEEEIDPGVGNLVVSKIVGGNTGDRTSQFTFAVVLSDTSINGTYGGLTFVNGVAHFTLRHGERKTATGLPAGITYSVMEGEANQDGYTTVSNHRDGTISEQGSIQATFYNTRGELLYDDPLLEEFEDPEIPLSGFPNFPQTGDNSHPAFWLTLMILSAIGLVLTGFFFNGKGNLISIKSRRMRK